MENRGEFGVKPKLLTKNLRSIPPDVRRVNPPKGRRVNPPDGRRASPCPIDNRPENEF